MMSRADVTHAAAWTYRQGETISRALSAATLSDDLSRDVHCLLGIPVDAIDMAAVLSRMDAAAAGTVPFLISTANLNFLVHSLSDAEFRELLLLSDLCVADGVPIVLMARLMGIPIPERVAGSDIFEALRSECRSSKPMTICLFGGAEGAAIAAAEALNATPGGLVCVGAFDPGFGTVEQLSTNKIVDYINSSKANFLAVSLGAVKGQAWLKQNHHRVRIPIRAHLGAVINFQSGVIKRAPYKMQKWGLEWLWRIKEEPYLWKRYGKDGVVLARLLATRVLPLAILARWQRFRSNGAAQQQLSIETSHSDGKAILRLSGVGTKRHIRKAIFEFSRALAARPNIVVVDLSALRAVDARFLGLCLMFRKQVNGLGARLAFTGATRRLSTLFRLNGVRFLLTDNQDVSC